MTTDGLLSVTNWLYLVSLFVAAVASVGLWRLSIASGEEKDRQLEQYKTDKANELERYKTDAGERIVQANTTAATARAEAARANERAGQANERAATMEARVAELNLQLAKLKAPRLIEPDQAITIATECQTLAGTKFDMAVTEGDPEALQLQNLLENILIAAGWDQQAWMGYGNHSYREGRKEFGYATTENVYIMMNKDHADALRPAATILSNALSRLGIASRINTEDWQSDGDKTNPLTKENLHVVVGRKVL